MGSAGRRRRVGVIVAVAGLAVFSLCLCGIGSAIGLSMRRGEDQPDPPRQEPLPPPAPESVPPSPSASPSPSPTSATATRVVPDVVGARLAEALRRLDAAGLDEIEPIDATGQDRVVVNSENWVVRAQQPAAGTRTGTGTTVTLRPEHADRAHGGEVRRAHGGVGLPKLM